MVTFPFLFSHITQDGGRELQAQIDYRLRLSVNQIGNLGIDIRFHIFKNK